MSSLLLLPIKHTNKTLQNPHSQSHMLLPACTIFLASCSLERIPTCQIKSQPEEQPSSKMYRFYYLRNSLHTLCFPIPNP